MLTPIANVHQHKLPRPGALVEVHIDRLGPNERYRRFIVESFPLTDAASRHSIGIHTCVLRALDNSQRFKVSGIFCVEVG